MKEHHNKTLMFKGKYNEIKTLKYGCITCKLTNDWHLCSSARPFGSVYVGILATRKLL